MACLDTSKAAFWFWFFDRLASVSNTTLWHRGLCEWFMVVQRIDWLVLTGHDKARKAKRTEWISLSLIWVSMKTKSLEARVFWPVNASYSGESRSVSIARHEKEKEGKTKTPQARSITNETWMTSIQKYRTTRGPMTRMNSAIKISVNVFQRDASFEIERFSQFSSVG